MGVSDFIVIGVFLFAVFGIGAYFTRRAHQDTTQYFLSGRRLPWWIAGTSMVATSFSCDTPLYVTQLVRSGGISLNWQWWSFGIGGLFSAFLLARLWRRAEVVTDVELCELRYGNPEGAILRTVKAGWMALVINTIAMSWVLLAMAKIIGAVWGGPQWVAVVGAATLAVAYSFLAGFWGVVVTDVAQFIVALLGAIVLAVVAVNAAGGMDSIVATLPTETMTLLPHISTERLFTGGFWSGAMGGFIVYASIQWWANINADGGGKVIQRMSAAKTEGHAFGATLWFNIAHYALRTWPWVIAALASLVLYPNLADDELAYPRMIIDLLPAPWTGVLLAGLIAAFMSTVDTQLNWGASYLTHDFYRRWIAPDRDEKHYILAAKLSMVLLIVITSVIASLIDSVTEAFKFLIAFGAGTGPVLILRWFWWRINAWSEISAMIASTVISSAVYLIDLDFSFPMRVVIIALGSMIVWLYVTIVTDPPRNRVLQRFYRKTQPPGNWQHVIVMFSPDDLGTMPHHGKSLLPDIYGWLGGVLLTFGLMFSIGYLLLDRWIGLALAVLATAAGGYIVLRWWREHGVDSSTPRRGL